MEKKIIMADNQNKNMLKAFNEIIKNASPMHKHLKYVLWEDDNFICTNGYCMLVCHDPFDRYGLGQQKRLFEVKKDILIESDESAEKYPAWKRVIPSHSTDELRAVSFINNWDRDDFMVASLCAETGLLYNPKFFKHIGKVADWNGMKAPGNGCYSSMFTSENDDKFIVMGIRK